MKHMLHELQFGATYEVRSRSKTLSRMAEDRFPGILVL
jgi:hypothetical protein